MALSLSGGERRAGGGDGDEGDKERKGGGGKGDREEEEGKPICYEEICLIYIP